MTNLARKISDPDQLFVSPSLLGQIAVIRSGGRYDGERCEVVDYCLRNEQYEVVLLRTGRHLWFFAKYLRINGMDSAEEFNDNMTTDSPTKSVFKVGDRVQVNDPYHARFGQVGEISEVVSAETVRVTWADGKDLPYDVQELKAVQR